MLPILKNSRQLGEPRYSFPDNVFGGIYSQTPSLRPLSGLILHVLHSTATLTSLAPGHGCMKMSFIHSTFSQLAVAESVLVLVCLSCPFVHGKESHPPLSQDTAGQPHFLCLNRRIWTHHCFPWSLAKYTKISRRLGCYWHRYIERLLAARSMHVNHIR